MQIRTTDLSTYLHEVYAVERALAPGSVNQLEITLKLFRRWLEHYPTFEDLQPAVVSSWLIWLRNTRSPVTASNKRRGLLALWRHAFEHDLVETNFRRVCKIRVPQTIPLAWSLEELGRLVEVCQSLKGYMTNGIPWTLWWEMLILIGYDTGLRKSDLLALKFDQIGDDGVIRTLQHKTGWEHDPVLSPQTLDLVHRSVPPDREIILDWPYLQKTYYRWWRRIRKRAGLADGATQKLRRTGASYVEHETPGAAMAYLGHKTPGLAYQSYVDPRIAYPKRPRPPSFLPP